MQDKVNILLVDDQPAKLLSYEVMLGELGENLIKAESASEAFSHLLKHDIAVVLIDVCMPELDGFQLATMIREHPRFQKTAIIFVSAIQFSDVDHLRGYAIGAVDYVSVPVVPEVLRAKVKVFIELHRKTRELESLNDQLERRVAERTAELEASTARLRESEERRTLALSAGNMGSWDLDTRTGRYAWDEGQYRIYGVDPTSFVPTDESIRALVHPDDYDSIFKHDQTGVRQREFRVVRPSGEIRWCFGVSVSTLGEDKAPIRLNGVTVDITARRNAEEKQTLLAREVDHRARNSLAVVQSILRLTRADTAEQFVSVVEARIQALAATHKLLTATRWEGASLREIIDAEMAPYRSNHGDHVITEGPEVVLKPSAAQSVALALHELATNAAKHGCLSRRSGALCIKWVVESDALSLKWNEQGGPATAMPTALGFGLKIVRSGIEEQLDGQVTYDWRKEGLSCKLSVPITHVVKVLEDQPVAGAPSAALLNGHSYAGLAGKRILVVEDEHLISMLVKEMLSELGVGVIGPVNTLAEGFVAVQDELLDGAILDLNLRGQHTYPLAEVLKGKGVPFVFMTGYDSETIDSTYSHVPILQKPIEFDELRHTLASNLVSRVA